jgi:hypothetical protein
MALSAALLVVAAAAAASAWPAARSFHWTAVWKVGTTTTDFSLQAIFTRFKLQSRAHNHRGRMLI